MWRYLRVVMILSVTVINSGSCRGRFCNPLNEEARTKCQLQTKRCCRNMDQQRENVLLCMERVSSLITKSTDCSCQYHPCLEEFSQGSRFKVMKSRAIRIVPPKFQENTGLVLGRPLPGIQTDAQTRRKESSTSTPAFSSSFIPPISISTPASTSTFISSTSTVPYTTKTTTTTTTTRTTTVSSTTSTTVSSTESTSSTDTSPTSTVQEITSILTSLSTEADLFNDFTTVNFNFGG